MPIKKYNPTSPARRFMTVSSFKDITGKASKSLFFRLLKEKAAEIITAE